jgi:hypothetical protein
MMMINTMGYRCKVFVSVVLMLLGIVARVDSVFVRSSNRRRLIYVEKDANTKNQHFNGFPPSEGIFDDFARDFVRSKGR